MNKKRIKKNIEKLIIAFFILIVFISLKYIITEKSINKEIIAINEIEYKVKGETETNRFKKPKFNNKALNNLIDTYIETNKCSYLDYSIFKINKEIVNVFLDCGNPSSIIFDYKKDKSIYFEEIVKDKDKLSTQIKNLINLKYPTFVTEEVDILNGIYNIKSNEIIAYYKTNNYGDVSIKINNNEIKSLMLYEMTYDEFYENEIYTLDPNKKTIAFTFDDGPSFYDLEIIDTLKDAHATSTFFIVGNRIENFKDSIFKMVDSGMEVGNHTYSHRALTKLSSSIIKEEINKTNDKFKNLTGLEMNLLRPSYGAINKRVLIETQMPVILWSIDTEDWRYRDANRISETILKEVEDGAIILMHSLYESTSEAVKIVLPELYKMGYQVVSVSELANLKGKDILIGYTYGKIE